MKKKYIIKRKRKTISTMYIFIILLILLLSTSVGYSKFSSNINIIGRIELGEKEDDFTELPTELSNSELQIHIGSSWQQEDLYVYNMNLKLINLDENLTEWVVTVDFPPSVSVEKSDFWCAAEVEVLVLEDCSRLIFTNYDWNGDKPLNSEIDFGFNIAFTEQVEMEISNVTFNRKLLENVEYIGQSTMYLKNN